MEDFLRIGVIIKPHGLKGEVKVYPTTDDMRRFDMCDEVYLDIRGKKKLVHVEGVKYFKKQVILKFEEFGKIEDIEAFKNVDILVDREHAVPLEEGEYFIADLIGLEVYDDENNEKIGVVKDVMEMPANNVYVIKNEEGKELLFPAIDDCIKDIDMENKKIIVHVMPGLLDL